MSVPRCVKMVKLKENNTTVDFSLGQLDIIYGTSPILNVLPIAKRL